MYTTEIMGIADEFDSAYLPEKPTRGNLLVGFPCREGSFFTILVTLW